jgi:hypothetical protein
MSLKAILSFMTVGLLLLIIYKQDEVINKKESQIIELKAKIDTLYSEKWILKTYIDVKEGRAEE